MNPPSHAHEHRLLIERLGQAFREGIEESLGRSIGMGLPGIWDDHETQSRPVPIRAIVVRFGRPLRDMALLVFSLKEEVVLPLAQAAVAQVLKELEIKTGFDDYGLLGEVTIEPAIEYETNAEAMEQCDGFYLEPTIHFALPTGDLCVVMGVGLLESAHSLLAGEPDPNSEPIPQNVDGPATLELAEDIGVDAPSAQVLVTAPVRAAGPAEAGPAEAGPAEAGPADAPDVDPGADHAGDVVYTDHGPMSVAAYESMLAAEAAADAAAVVIEARDAAATAAANAAAAAAAARSQPEQRWASLLSGVEVELSAELGRTNLALGDLASLVSDSVLTLDQLVDEPVNVYVNGTAYATARLVVVEGEFGIEILDVVGAAQLAEQLAA